MLLRIENREPPWKNKRITHLISGNDMFERRIQKVSLDITFIANIANDKRN